ncbi:MAG: hypothetical protein MI922_08535, partial [Bacteroidales bacterium]|nr:hypothetical protein [Bacteroidales bacterium]
MFDINEEIRRKDVWGFYFRNELYIRYKGTYFKILKIEPVVTMFEQDISTKAQLGSVISEEDINSGRTHQMNTSSHKSVMKIMIYDFETGDVFFAKKGDIK